MQWQFFHIDDLIPIKAEKSWSEERLKFITFFSDKLNSNYEGGMSKEE